MGKVLNNFNKISRNCGSTLCQFYDRFREIIEVTRKVYRVVETFG